MNNSFCLFSSLILIIGTVATPKLAIAGEGGIASSIAASLDGGVITDISISSAIGKTSAYATATVNSDGTLETFAIGTGGELQFDGLSRGTAFVENPENLGTTQENTFSALAIDSTILNPSSFIDND